MTEKIENITIPQELKQILTNIQTGKITELTELNYVGQKLVYDRIRNPKPGWEIRLEVQVKKLRQQAKLVRKKKHSRISWD